MNKKFNIIVDDTREQQFQKEIKSLEKKLNKIDGIMTIKEIGKNVICDNTYTLNREYEITLSIDLQIPNFKLVAVNKLNIDKYIYIQIDNTIQVPDSIKTLYICQHCNTNRKRKMYYIFFNELEGKFIVVGSSCCKMYFGIDVEKKLKKFQNIINYCEGIKDNSKIKIHKVKIVDIIEKILVFDITENTAILKYSDYKKDLKLFVNQFEAFLDMVEYLQYNKEDINKKAIEIKDYVLNMDNKENNEYLSNLKDIFKCEYMNTNFINYILYCTKLVSLDKYKKELENNKKETSNHIGEIKDKVELELTLYNTVTLDGFYGISYMYLFKDKQGNIFKWVTNTVVLEDNRTYIIKGTIKAHEEYKGTKQNVLTRCKVVGYEEQEIKECEFEYKLEALFNKYNKKTQIKYRNLIIDRLIKLTDIRKVEKYDCICFLTEIVENYSNKECDINKVVEFLNKKDIQNYMKENNIL